MSRVDGVWLWLSLVCASGDRVVHVVWCRAGRDETWRARVMATRKRGVLGVRGAWCLGMVMVGDWRVVGGRGV